MQAEAALLFPEAPVRERPLAMTGVHVGKIYGGSKTTTLRRKQLPEGWYRLMIGGKERAGRVYLEPLGAYPINWARAGERDKVWLARVEGYAGDVARFERVVRLIPGGADFLDGTVDLYLHRITKVEPH